MRTKKSCLALGLVLVLFFAGAAFAATTFLTIASGGVGGTYYPLGEAMAELLTRSGVGIEAVSHSTAASKENCRLVAADKAQIGMTMGSTLYQAYTGTEAFRHDGKLELLTLMNMYAAPQHLVTTTRTGIKTLEDIRGKRVSLGAPGGGDNLLSAMILETAGWNIDKDIEKQQLTQPEAVEALKDGDIDAAFFNFAVPASAIMEIAAVRDVVLIPLPGNLVEAICRKHPFLLPFTIEKGTYAKQDKDISTVSDANFLVVNPKMSDQTAYDCLKIFIEQRGALLKATPYAANFVPSKAAAGIIPFHPGAVRYFKGKGIAVK